MSPDMTPSSPPSPPLFPLAPEPSPAFSEGEKAAALLQDKLAHLSATAMGGLLASAAFACILVATHWSGVSHPVLLGWWGVVLALTAVRAILFYRFKRAPESASATTWMTRHLVGVTLSGVTWGAGGLLLFTPDSISHLAFLSMVLAGLAAGSVPIYAVSRRLVLAFALPACLPIIGRFLMMGVPISTAIGVAGLVFLSIMLGLAWMINRPLIRTFALKTERARIETQLLDLIERTNDLIQSVAPDGRILYVNRAWLDTLGYAPADIQRLNIFSVLHPDSHAHCRHFMERIMAGEQIGLIEVAFLTKSGRTVTAEGQVSLTSDNGRPVATRAIFRDITARQAAEQRLRAINENLDHLVTERTGKLQESEALYRNLVATVPGAVYEFRIAPDGQRTFLFMSKGITDLIGLSPEACVANAEAAFDRILPEARAALEDSIRQSLEGPSPWIYEFPAKALSGEVKWLHGHSVPHRKPDGAIHWHGVLTDITSGKEAESRLRTTQYAVDHATEFIFVISNKGNILDVNESACRRLGYTKQELLTKSVMDIDPDFPAAVWDDFWSAFKQNRRVRLETRHRSKSGDIYPVEVVANYILHEGKELDYAFVRDISERKQAEAALRTSQENLRLALAASNIGLWEWRIDTNEVSFSKECKHQLGYEEHELADRFETWASLLHHDDRDQAITYAQNYTAHPDGTFLQQFRMQHKDGTYRWIEARAAFVTEPDGRQVRLLGSHIDITERKATEHALQFLSTGLSHRTGDTFFGEMARHLAAILKVDVSFVGKLLPSHPPRIRTVGLSIDGELHLPVEYDLAHTPCEGVLGKGIAIFPSNVQRLFPDDRMLADLHIESYAAVPLFDTQGRPVGHVGVMSRRPIQDVTICEEILRLFAVRAGAEVERQRTEAKFQDLFEFSPDAVLMVNHDGIITLANRQAETLFGYGDEELVGLPVERLMPSAARSEHLNLRERFLGTSTPRLMGSGRDNLHAQKKDGVVFPVDIGLSPIQTEDGKMVVATIRDITERKQAEAALRTSQQQILQMQKMEAIGQLAGGIAHDFNNLLTAILGNAEIAMLKAETEHAARPNLARIIEAGQRASHVVKQILTFTRQQDVAKTVLSLAPIVTECLALMRATIPAGVELSSSCSADTPPVLANPSQIHQVLMNLCTNAWHAVGDKPGRVSVELAPVHLTTALYTPNGTLPPGHYARLSISDTGCGMTPDTVARIFDPFFTTKAAGQGTGLGLSVVHGIIQGHEGAITVESMPGRGTTFRLYFPAQEDSSLASSEQDSSATPHLQSTGTIRILYLDDEEMLVELVTAIFEPLGYQITGCTNPHHGLELLRDTPEAFDAIVTDYNMPEMSGLDVARAVHDIRASLPVVLVSGFLTPEDQDEARTAHVRETIYKPTMLQELGGVLKRLLTPPLPESLPPQEP